ncbi:hypothetical protein [Mesoplasma coleopterae]|uniref:hypothetical protein n=1 Tax=Mesoplasma coleopterae TaxID=324078 RepID=UPI000D028590|nr:hypothetical protein [Mesoplasma coleopterae]AVN62743.1 hypothetical protein CG000_00225 [Mesoplasma coleopterae]
MESVIEKLEKMANNIENSSYKVISEKIIKGLINAKFYSQDDLSKECFVSISQITKFAKKIGYSGYRELVFTLKNEYQHMGMEQNAEKINIIEKIDSIQKWILSNESFVNNLVLSIEKASFINLYVSYQVQHAANYIADIFANLNKVVRIVSHEIRNNLIKNKENEVNILIICSRDNETLLQVFNKENNEKQKSFLVTTERQREKVKINVFDEIIIDYKNDKSKNIFRNIAIEILFLHIYEKAQALS